jgi:multiple sugar transport system permease protein/sn-glycerol 3-phosphate transport system permease protein
MTVATAATSPLELSRAWRVVGHATCVVLCLSVLFPMALVVGAAFKPVGEIYAPLPWPQVPTWRNFVTLFATVPFAAYLWNSLATTALRVVGQMAVALLAAYGFARWEFRGREALFAAMLGAMMLPHQLTMLPIYLLIGQLDWFDTWQALVVPNLAAPFAAFLLRQHIRAFPHALFDAATMDGAGHWRCLWLVVVPNLGPVLSALAIVLSIECWNEYFWPLLVTDTTAARTIQVGMRSFLDEQFADYGALMAGATVASLPALALFFAFQRRVLETFAASGVKG